jgi:hypothetical protein
MIKIDYPDKKPAIKTEAGRELIFCLIRKRWVVITPEEWVRQNFLLYLTEVLKYPLSLIAVEKQVTLGELKKRFDIVVYDRETKPFMIVECKEMNVPLSEKVLQQVLRYNISLQTSVLVITNGSFCIAFEKAGDDFIEKDKITSCLYY